MRSKIGLIIALAAFNALGQPPSPPNSPSSASNETVVFRSDVGLVRVDAQVLDGGHTLANLVAQDFILRDEGKVVEIRNFARENMPLDVLLLIDVSQSMRSNVERIASASRQAMQVLKGEDRVAIMVFDRQTRMRMPFLGVGTVEQEFQSLLRQEKFKGGTDITRALYDAAEFMGRSARKEARKTIIIVTDDQTESMFQVDEFGVGRALANADTVLNALLAPDAMRGSGNYPDDQRADRRDDRRGGGQQRGGNQGGGQRRRGGLGGVIFGPMPGGGGYPGGNGGGNGGGSPRNGGSNRGGMNGPKTKSAGSDQIAHASGGDSFPVSDALALENTLTRMRQRYTLFFVSPSEARSGQERSINLELTEAIRSRYANAEVRFRRTYFASAGSGSAEPTYVPNDDRPVFTRPRKSNDANRDVDRPVVGPRPISDGSGSGPRGPNPSLGGSTTPKPAQVETPTAEPEQKAGGWRKVGESEPIKK